MGESAIIFRKKLQNLEQNKSCVSAMFKTLQQSVPLKMSPNLSWQFYSTTT